MSFPSFLSRYLYLSLLQGSPSSSWVLVKTERASKMISPVWCFPVYLATKSLPLVPSSSPLQEVQFLSTETSNLRELHVSGCRENSTSSISQGWICTSFIWSVAGYVELGRQTASSSWLSPRVLNPFLFAGKIVTAYSLLYTDFSASEFAKLYKFMNNPVK